MFVDLVSDSVQTVQLFEARSREAARDTSNALRFLFKGKETFALSRLAACEKQAKEMKAKSEMLEAGFGNAVEALNEMIIKSIKRQGDQVEANKAIQETRSKLQANK